MPASDRKGLDVPAEAHQAMEAVRDCLGASLVAAYLYGSAAEGGLRPQSDVDNLLVVDRPMAGEERQRFLDHLRRISGRVDMDDSRRPLDVIVFSVADLKSASYPVRCMFMYGEWLRDVFEAGHIPQPETNPEFTVLLAQARQCAIALEGLKARDVLPAISQEQLRRAIFDAEKELVANIAGDERNALLTLARMWRTLATGEIVSKDVAAAWAIPRLSGSAAAILVQARLAYLGQARDECDNRSLAFQDAIRELRARIAAC